MIKITSLNKIYKSKKRKRCHALNEINLTLPDAGLVFVLGKSGSGKSTLLNLIGGLDNITSGSIEVDGNDLARFKEKDFCNYRNSHIGFIFQDYHLIDELTVYENIKLSLDLENRNEKHLIGEALERVDLAGYEERYPTELSGGEQQRVAIARAIVKKPRIILADEPTGNLDTNTAKAIVELLKELSKECLILIVSHNVNDANNYADRIIELKKGQIISDKSRNPEFLDEVSLQNGELVYPQGLALSDTDIDFINKNLTKFTKKTDKFLPTNEPKNEAKKVKILNKHLTLGRELKLSGKFLKNKALAISFSAFMVAVIMVIMALAQTIIAFDGGEIVAEEMEKANNDSILLNKIASENLQERIDGNYRYVIDDNDISAIYEAGYKGTIYPVYNISLPVMDYRNAAGINIGYFHHGLYISESLGTMVVDEEFLIEKFGKLEYIAKAKNQHQSGIIITDYIADAILNLSPNYSSKTYEDILGLYYFAGWTVPQFYINGIINTGYREKHAEILDVVTQDNSLSVSDLYNDPAFTNLTSDIYGKLGYCFSLNPNLVEEYSDFEEFIPGFRAKVWPQRLLINGVYNLTDITNTYYSVYNKSLNDNEILFPYQAYNEIFGTEYTTSTLSDFTPHKIHLSQYRYEDIDLTDPLISIEVTIVGLVTYSRISMSDNIYNLFRKNNIYSNSLYLNGTEGIGAALDTAETLNFEPQSYAVEGVHTMTKAVDVFIPIFELIAIFLCVGVVFILVNFSSKMINDKMHEIGILKALGAKNSSIGVIFGLQVALIAILTCILATAGYFFFIDLANDVLIESLTRLAPNSVVLDLDFLRFQPEIALENCVLVAILALVSLVFPMIKIKAIKPVKIIKAKD